MVRFFVRRLLQALLTLFVATLIFHLAVTVLPGDPVRALFGFRAPPPELAAEIRHRFHLDDPYVVQYVLYLRDLITFDLGHSLPRNPFGAATRGASVNDIVATAWPYTAKLVGVSLAIQAVIGTVGGVRTVSRPRSSMSRAIVAGSVLMVSLPVIVTAYALQSAIGQKVGWLPSIGAGRGWVSYVLPVTALSGITLGTLVLLLRSELRDTMRAPFIRFVLASGLPPPRVVGVHALRVAIPPGIAYLAANLGQLVTGVLIVEAVFGLPGLGSVATDAIRRQDRVLLVSLVTLITVVVVLANLVADLLIAAVDPRVRLDRPEAET